MEEKAHPQYSNLSTEDFVGAVGNLRGEDKSLFLKLYLVIEFFNVNKGIPNIFL